MKSILDTESGTCFCCGSMGQTQEHHIFYGPNRHLSEKYGLKVYLCLGHHILGREAVHGGNRELDQQLKETGQRAFEARHGSRKQFLKIFGRNYLEKIE